MEFRKTPTKCWLREFNLQHLSKNFEQFSFETVGSIAAMDISDLDVIFKKHELKLGERRILQQQITAISKKDLISPVTTSTCSTTSNSSVTARQSTRKKLTYGTHSKEVSTDMKCKVKSILSPLESYIEQQRSVMKEQENKVRQVEDDIEQFKRERTAFNRTPSNQPSCSKCHKQERHNRLNCPYPSPCLSAKFCKNIEKHPDDKQFLKQQHKQLAEEIKCLQSLKTELENKQRSAASVNNRYSTRVKQILIDSNPEKYIRIVNGKAIEDWRLINKDTKILEQHFKGNIPSISEARETIENLETLAPTSRNSKTTVHNPYKKLWEDRGISWPRRRTASERKDNVTLPSSFTSTCTNVDDKNTFQRDTEIHSPQRKKIAIASVGEDHDDDFQLALGLQESLRTLPASFDWETFEKKTEQPSTTRVDAAVEKLSGPVNTFTTNKQQMKPTHSTSNLETLVEAALKLSDTQTDH